MSTCQYCLGSNLTTTECVCNVCEQHNDIFFKRIKLRCAGSSACFSSFTVDEFPDTTQRDLCLQLESNQQPCKPLQYGATKGTDRKNYLKKAWFVFLQQQC